MFSQKLIRFLCILENIPEQTHFLISSSAILFTKRSSIQYVQPIYLGVRGRVSLLQTPLFENPFTSRKLTSKGVATTRITARSPTATAKAPKSTRPWMFTWEKMSPMSRSHLVSRPATRRKLDGTTRTR
jgi:hypothetical protein